MSDPQTPIRLTRMSTSVSFGSGTGTSRNSIRPGSTITACRTTGLLSAIQKIEIRQALLVKRAEFLILPVALGIRLDVVLRLYPRLRRGGNILVKSSSQAGDDRCSQRRAVFPVKRHIRDAEHIALDLVQIGRAHV